jgi:uncharacterized protein
MSAFAHQYGPWAVVTGASDGLGRELAILLAKRSIKLVLVARRLEALEDLARSLPVESVILPADLGLASGRQAVIEQTRSLDVGLLVNAAGFGSAGPLLDTPTAVDLDMVEVNCKATLELTHEFGRRMKQRGRGGMIQFASIVAYQGAVRAANYAATKAYVLSLGEALHEELAPHGIDVLTCSPGPTDTGFGKRSGMRLTNAESAAMVAADILAALGRKSTVIPGIKAKILYAALMTAPRFLRVKIMKAAMAGMT